MSRLFAAVLLLSFATVAAATDRPPLGSWERHPKEHQRIVLTFERHRLHVLWEIAERYQVFAEADYSVSPDGVIYGIVTVTETRGGIGTVPDKCTDVPFAFRTRVEKGTLTIKNLKGGIISMPLGGEYQPQPADQAPVTQVVVLWSPQVVTGVDPVHQGAPIYGLAGRVFLFGPELKENLIADGDLVVDLYATPPEQPQVSPACSQTWVIKKDVLNREYLRKDGLDKVYTLNLPWPGYRPDITQVRLSVRYEPAKGVPISTQDLVTLNRGLVVTPTDPARAETGDSRPTVALPPAAPRQQAGDPMTRPEALKEPRQPVPTATPCPPWISTELTRRMFRRVLMPPIREGFPPPGCEAPPDEATVLRVMPHLPTGIPGLYEEFRYDIEVITEKIVDRVDPPRFFPLVGAAQLHHCHWKCSVYYTETVELSYPFPAHLKTPHVQVIYIDTDHLHRCDTTDEKTKAPGGGNPVQP